MFMQDFRFSSFRLWLLAGLIVLAVHAALLLVLLHYRGSPASEQATAPMAVTLAAVPTSASRASVPIKPQHAPEKKRPEHKPEKMTRSATGPQVRPAHSLSRPAPHIDAQNTGQTRAPRQGSAEQLRQAKQRWYGAVLALLQKNKRYPPLALLDNEQGVATVRFVLDRQGQVLSDTLVNSSGHALLDREAIALVHRVAPFPSPPSAVSGQQIRLQVPISFRID